MPSGLVTSYRAEWNAQQNKGLLKLMVWTSSTTIEELTVATDSAQEMLLLLDLLRNEKPISYNSETMTIVTTQEIVGEGEK